MGHQQLLLVVLGAIIAGIAVVVGIQIFSSSAEQVNIDQISIELLRIANHAQEYYAKPARLGDGGKRFAGFSIPADPDTPENAYYTITDTQPQKIGLLATCRTAEGVMIETVVCPTSYTATIHSPGEAPGC